MGAFSLIVVINLLNRAEMLTSRVTTLSNASRVFARLASSQSALIPVVPNVMETTSGVKACLMESPVRDVSLSQHLKKEVCDVSLVVKAGTRFESDVEQELGLAQMLKTFSLLTHEGATLLRSVGSMEILGCEYGITVTRELIIYKLACEKQYLDDVLPFVTSALSKPRFAKWELSPTKYQAKLDSFLFSQDPVAVTVDLLHKAAFRKGLGNSLQTTEAQVDALTTDKLLAYHEKTFAPGNVFLSTQNAPQDLVGAHFESFGKADSKSIIKSEKSEFVSDEIRSDDNSKDSVVVAIARSSGPTNTKEAIVDSLLAHLLQGKSDASIGPKDFLNLPLSGEHGEWVKGFQCDYSDAGLFGFLLSCQADNAGSLLNGLMTSLKSLESSLTDDHVAIARNSHLRGMLTELSTPSAQVEHMATQMILGTAIEQEKYNAILSSVTKADLKKAISDFVTAPKSLAAHGNCSHVPFLEEL